MKQYLKRGTVILIATNMLGITDQGNAASQTQGNEIPSSIRKEGLGSAGSLLMTALPHLTEEEKEKFTKLLQTGLERRYQEELKKEAQKP